MKKRNYLLSLAFAAMLSLSCLTGCGENTETAKVPEIVEETTSVEIIEETASVEIMEGGVLCLKVNPEIAVHYDNEGLVTKVEARNDDGKLIVKDYTNYLGKETHEVVKELVAAIDKAGYFVEEVEGISRQITIEIEVGSKIPNDKFIDEVVAEVKNYVASKEQNSSINLENNTDYGITDYNDTDYGPNNDGVTDYNDTDYGTATTVNKTAPAAAPTPAPVASTTAAPNTDYGDTNYDDTDYGPNNDGVTDYNEPVTDYNDHVTDYGDTSYDDHVTDYGNTNYDDGKTDYDDGKTDYDDGKTDYDNDSGYDD